MRLRDRAVADIVRQVTAEGLDPHITQVSTIMTRNPMVTRDTTSATEALELMVQRHFRHLVSITWPYLVRNLMVWCDPIAGL